MARPRPNCHDHEGTHNGRAGVGAGPEHRLVAIHSATRQHRPPAQWLCTCFGTIGRPDYSQ